MVCVKDTRLVAEHGTSLAQWLMGLGTFLRALNNREEQLDLDHST